MRWRHASFGGGERRQKAADAGPASWMMKIGRHDEPSFPIQQAADVRLLRRRVWASGPLMEGAINHLTTIERCRRAPLEAGSHDSADLDMSRNALK
jgi:hypothetical protein